MLDDLESHCLVIAYVVCMGADSRFKSVSTSASVTRQRPHRGHKRMRLANPLGASFLFFTAKSRRVRSLQVGANRMVEGLYDGRDADRIQRRPINSISTGSRCSERLGRLIERSLVDPRLCFTQSVLDR